MFCKMGKSNRYGSVEKKKKDKQVAAGRKQSIKWNPIPRSNTVKFVNKPLSNHDLYQ